MWKRNQAGFRTDRHRRTATELAIAVATATGARAGPRVVSLAGGTGTVNARAGGAARPTMSAPRGSRRSLDEVPGRPR